VRWGNNINWMAAAPDGSLIVVDGRDLRRIDRAGRLGLLARNVGEMMMGMWVDGRSNVYVAVYGARAVMRVAPDGRTTTVARSAAPWAPSGVMVAPNGDLWLLEYSTSNEARVRRIARDGRATVFGP
jgi:sugar lactone lactonase YvrE